MDAVSSAAIEKTSAPTPRARTSAPSAPADATFAALLAPMMGAPGDGAAPQTQTPVTPGNAAAPNDADAAAAPDADTSSNGVATSCATPPSDTAMNGLAALLATQAQPSAGAHATPSSTSTRPVDGAAADVGATAQGATAQSANGPRRLGQDKQHGEPASAAADQAKAATQRATPGVGGDIQTPPSQQSAAATESQTAALDPAQLAGLAGAAQESGALPADPSTKPALAGAPAAKPGKSTAPGLAKAEKAGAGPTPADQPLRQLRGGGDDGSQPAAIASPAALTPGAHHGTGAQDGAAGQANAAGAGAQPTAAAAPPMTTAAAQSPAGVGGDAGALDMPTLASAPGASPGASQTPPGAPASTAPTGHAFADRGAAAAGQVASQIARRFDGRTTSFDVRLDPAELGRVDVRIEVGADRKVKATVTAESASTLADLVTASRDLEQALSDAGLDLSDSGLTFNLSTNLSGDGGAAFANARDTQQPAAEMARGHAADAGAQTDLAEPRRAALPLSLSRWSGARLDVWA